jgi:hypothetical protein
MESDARGREFARHRLKISGNGRGSRLLSPYLLVFTLSVRRQFVLRLSIFPLSRAEAAGYRQQACLLGGGGHDHGAGHDCRHDKCEVRRRRACTSSGVSEAWRHDIVLVPTAARARHGGGGLSDAWCDRAQRGGVVLVPAATPRATRTQRLGAPPTPARLLLIFTEVEDGGTCCPFTLMAMRSTGTPLRDVDDGGHLPRQRWLLPLNSDHCLPPLCMANGGLFLAQRLDLGLADSGSGL